jgi:hypothetical protein
MITLVRAFLPGLTFAGALLCTSLQPLSGAPLPPAPVQERASPATRQSPQTPQTPQDGWNTPRALELMERAVQVRQNAAVDTAMHTYQADARGFVYFFIDRQGESERTLVKADQIALEVYWRAPNDTKQRIVGLRDEKVLPTNIRYHLDHLTVVQDEFGDLIRLGDGDEVAAVLHPAAPGAHRRYDFRLADSLTLTFAGGREPVRVYEVEVRPRDLDSPGFLGSVFLDRATAAIVRMNFSFTPSSYVDPYLDYIRISLDNGLWLGRFWLPYRQEVELRREMPQLDFLVGSIIRGRFEIGNYRFNDSLPDGLFRTRGVSAVSEEQRRAFPFEEPLYADLEVEGLGPSPSLAEVERQVRTMVSGRALSGLRATRLFVPSVSDAVRYNRAEGLALGAGMAVRPRATWAVRGHGAWAVSREAFSGRIEATGGDAHPGSGVALYTNDLRDMGPVPGASGLENTLASLAGDDYLDPYFATGVSIFHRLGPSDRQGVMLALSYEDHESAALVLGDDDSFRPVRTIDDGVVRALDLTLDLPRLAANVDLTTHARLGRTHQQTYLTGQLHLSWRRDEAFRQVELALDARVGAAGAGAPRQELFLLGGRGTLPGHPYRERAGDRFWLVSAEVGREVSAPWIGVHAFLAAGRAWMVDRPVPEGWPGGDMPAKASLGVGLDLFWNVLRVDLARGIGLSGDWAVVVGVDSRFHPWM